MSETNVQLFPGVFRSTVGGDNPGFFLHSDGRVGIGNDAPSTRPVWSSNDNDRNKLNVSGHTHIEGNLNVSGFVYGDGSNLTGTALPWQQSTPDVATDIKYEGGNVGIGGAASTNKLKVYGTVEATSFVEGGTAISSTYATQTALTNGLSVKQDAGSSIFLNSSSSIRQDTTTWTGNPGTQGKLEYHSNRWYIVAGSNSNELARFRRDGSDKSYITNDGHYVGGYLRSDLKIGRTSHSNGYLVGSYNSVGPNDARTNPIYTIGSNYMPSDTSLGDMYGIGYTHNNFTSILSGGWGMYVAADGDARIGLNGSHGHIKNTGHIYCGGTVHLSGSGSQGIRSATGNYGTVQTTGGGNGGWEGYSIDGRYVFMSADSNQCGIYNDVDNEWMIYCERNANVRLYDNGYEKLQISSPCEFSGGLRIWGYEATIDYTDPEADYFTNGGSIQAESPYALYGLFVQYHIRAQGISVFSDKRIKRDFIEIDDTFALDKLRQLKPTSYRYKDKTRRTTDRVLGFIAQEVAEVLPDAISITKEVLPNIQLEASIKKIDEESFELTLKEPHSVAVGARLEIKAPKLDHMEVEVTSVTNDTTFTVLKDKKKHLNIDKVGDRVWVYGEYVDDFHNLNKDAIWTIATAALQEVDRQLQAEKEKVKSLEERLAALEAIVLNQ